MDYFNQKYSMRFRYEDELPAWLPKSGLVYYDDFSRRRGRAMTGQAYTEKSGASDALSYTTVGGRRCLYKEGPDNSLSFALPGGAMTDYTWGCWVYDALGTCTNQQVFDLWNEGSSEKCYLTYFNSYGRFGVGHWSYTEDKSLSSASSNVQRQAGDWKFIYGWHGSEWFGVRMPPVEDGENIGAARDERIIPVRGTLLQNPQCYGVAIRCAFMYTRVITEAEGMQIYNGSKDMP